MKTFSQYSNFEFGVFISSNLSILLYWRMLETDGERSYQIVNLPQKEPLENSANLLAQTNKYLPGTSKKLSS